MKLATQKLMSYCHKLDIPLFQLDLSFNYGSIVVESIDKLRGPPPAGQINTKESVPSSIIGHWLDLNSRCGETLYRRYIQRGVPINLDNAQGRQRRLYALTRYCLRVPVLPEAVCLVLYEQSRPNPGHEELVRRARLKMNLQGDSINL